MPVLIVLEDLKKDIALILESCESKEPSWNGSDEVLVHTFDDERAVNELAELFLTTFKLNLT